MTRHEAFTSPELQTIRRNRSIRFLLESLAVLVVATLLILVPSTARSPGAVAGTKSQAAFTAVDELAAREVEVQRARRLG
ncbi:hypothetical protein [Thermaurantiacus sp.]